MKKYLLLTTLLMTSLQAFAMRTDGDFAQNKCGRGAFGGGQVEICTGFVIGAPVDPLKVVSHLQIGQTVYAAATKSTPGRAPSPTQPLNETIKETQMMGAIENGEKAPRANAAIIKAEITRTGLNIDSVKVTLPNGSVIEAKGFSAIGGAF